MPHVKLTQKHKFDMTIKRKLFYVEQHLFLEGDNSFEPMTLNITPIIKGNIPEERVKIALAKLQERHPALRARIKDEHIYYEEANYPPIPLRIVKRVTEDTWKQEKEKYGSESWNYEEGPMCRVLWVRSEKISEFVITGHHVIIDGRSLFILAKDFYTFLNQPDKEVKPYLPLLSMKEIFPNTVLTWKQKVAGYIWTQIRCWILFFTAWNKKIYPTRGKALSLRLDEETSRVLRETCKKYDVSPGNISIVLFAKLFKKYFHPQKSKCTFEMPLDLRHYSSAIEKDMIFSHATQPFIHKFHIRGNENMWKQACIFKQKLNDEARTKQKTHNSSLLHSYAQRLVFADYFFSRIANLVVKKRLTTAPALSTSFINLGLIDFSLKNPEFELYSKAHVPEIQLPYFISAAYLIMIDNFGTAFEYSLSFNEADTSEAKMTQMLTEFEETIKELAKG
jgi:NRPS condensation-like uncharacterized protein